MTLQLRSNRFKTRAVGRALEIDVAVADRSSLSSCIQRRNRSRSSSQRLATCSSPSWAAASAAFTQSRFGMRPRAYFAAKRRFRGVSHPTASRVALIWHGGLLFQQDTPGRKRLTGEPKSSATREPVARDYLSSGYLRRTQSKIASSSPLSKYSPK